MAGSDRELLDLALGTAREAAALVVRLRGEGVRVASTKSSPVDVVTDADRACEELIRSRLRAARPDDGVVGEEGDDVPGTSGVRWIVDPIDGTVNYLYGLPHYAVSIAAARGEEIVAGVVLGPQLGLEYAAARGGGATCNGAALAVRTPPGLDQSLVATGFGYAAEVRERQARSVASLLPRVRDIRRLGSCALDLCAVAAGQVDAYVEEGPHEWDHAAAGLVAREAGASLRVSACAAGHDLVVCAPAEGFAEFSALVDECGFGE